MNGQRQIWWESGFNCDRYQVNSQIQGVENVWNHHIIFWEVGDEKFEYSVLIYYSFTYILVPDVTLYLIGDYLRRCSKNVL